MKLSRRNLLATATTTALAASVPAIADTSKIDGLWNERKRILAALDANTKANDAATATLPAWAAPGPCQIDSDGNRCGMETGWPEVADPTPPEYRGAIKLIRLSPHDARRAYEQWLMMFGYDSIGNGLSPESRSKGRARYRENMRKVIARVREQRRLRDEVGLTALNQQVEALCRELWAIEDRIRAAAKSGDLSAVAAAAIVGIAYENGMDDLLPDAARVMLEAIKPQLRGAVATDIAALLAADPETTLHQFPFVM